MTTRLHKAIFSVVYAALAASLVAMGVHEYRLFKPRAPVVEAPVNEIPKLDCSQQIPRESPHYWAYSARCH